MIATSFAHHLLKKKKKKAYNLYHVGLLSHWAGRQMVARETAWPEKPEVFTM